MENSILPIMLIALGAAIMVYNIRKYFTLVSQLSSLHTSKKRFTRRILFVYIVLLVFFLIGYVVIGFSMLFPSNTFSHSLIGLIFFFGSVFVLIGLLLQLSMSYTIQKSSLEITQTLVASVEARDTNLNGHSIHVSRLIMLLYHYLPKERRRSMNPDDLEYAALLHDIGKLGVSEQVLNKEGALEPHEWAEIHKHPQIGKNILGSLTCFGEISEWVLYHHERCDGKGYLSLPKEQIPYQSLMIAVVDTYSAITMKRSYRGAKGYEEAAMILSECRGTQLDKELVDIFLTIPKTEIDNCMPKDDMKSSLA